MYLISGTYDSLMLFALVSMSFFHHFLINFILFSFADFQMQSRIEEFSKYLFELDSMLISH